MRPLLLALTAVFLTAPLAGHAAPPPTGALDITGTEPFWSAQIRHGFLKFRSADEDHAVVYRGVRRTQARGWTIWKGSHGKDLIEIRLRRNRKCDDGMSDRYYPYDAWIFFGPGGHREGCAYRAGRLPPDIVYPQ